MLLHSVKLYPIVLVATYHSDDLLEMFVINAPFVKLSSFFVLSPDQSEQAIAQLLMDD